MPGGAEDTRLLATLERLLAIPSADLHTALTHACNVVADALRADKIDAFLHDPARDSLVALGTSTQPLSGLQRRAGLDVLPVANGGRVVHVYQTGKIFRTGRLREDLEELLGVRETLKIESKLGAPLEIAGRRRGVLMIASLHRDFFTEEDARFADLVVRWVGAVAHRAELVETIERNAVEQGRRAVAEELVTVLAHDLRNYLSPIGGRVQLLQRRAMRDHRDDDVRDADAALRGVLRLSRMISDILDVARIDQGVFHVDVQPVDLAAVAREIAATISTPQHPVRVQASEEVIVGADPARIAQCVENLVSNAVAHSPRGAPVTILVGKTLLEDGEWGVLEVQDEGPGIPPDILPHLFERGKTGPGSTGLGLGLYLAKRIAAAHGGELQVSSAPGRGAQFKLMLPGYRAD